MIFGTRDHFGIECQILRSQDQHIVGDIWLWGNGLRIGDEISGVELPLILDCLSGPLHLRRDRCDPFFDQMTKEEVVAFFLQLIYTEHKIVSEIEATADIFHRYLVISAFDLEGFDSVFMVLLGRCDSSDRLIWTRKGTDAIHEVQLACGEYDGHVLFCYDWLEEQTGYRSCQRTWLGLSESQQAELRSVVLVQQPHLGKLEHRETLAQAASKALEAPNENGRRALK